MCILQQIRKFPYSVIVSTSVSKTELNLGFVLCEGESCVSHNFKRVHISL